MKSGEGGYRPYFDPDFDFLVERIHPPRVCVDNDACENCTLVKVDSANRHGILLEMVQVLTDLDLIISKSYISSDGGWFMDVFHVTDELGEKLTDPSLIQYIQQSLVARRKRDTSAAGEAQTCLGRVVECRPRQLAASEYTALELTGTDRPGILSEVSTVLAKLDCQVVSSQAWTHNSRAACLIYVINELTGKPISDPVRLAQIEEQVENVVAARYEARDRWHVKLCGPAAGRVHTERRLHQLMHGDGDYEEEEEGGASEAASSTAGATSASAGTKKGRVALATQVSIDSCEERGYSVVNIHSRDRPKLLFDTVCTLTDMDYVVSHATVSSHGPLAVQEYFIRRLDGRALDAETERRRVARCLVAAIERRVSHGLRLGLCTRNRTGLLSDVTRVLGEHGLSLTRAEISTRGERAIGSFYVADASGEKVSPGAVEAVREEIGGTVTLEETNSSSSTSGLPLVKMNINSPWSMPGTGTAEERPRFSLGSLLRSQIERFSNNFGSIRS